MFSLVTMSRSCFCWRPSSVVSQSFGSLGMLAGWTAIISELTIMSYLAKP
jgi:hypothetical protein